MHCRRAFRVGQIPTVRLAHMSKLTHVYQKPSFWRKYWGESLIIVFGLVCINLIFISKAFRQTYTIDPTAAAQLGSFVGGYIGSIFALVSVVLLFSTLNNQRRASEKQHFETKYFELLKMHRDNVAELEVGEASGRRLFVLLLRELRCVLEVLRPIAKAVGEPLTQELALHVAYYSLFFGVGPNSSRMLRMSLSTFSTKFIEAVEQELNRPETKKQFQDERKFGYVPFEGHQSRLGHYYRHLYQMVRYVDQQTLDIDKYEYVKTIRAQLSTHEQALLLINSLTPMGRDWWQKGLIVRYRLVQNIPRDFFDCSTELDVSPLFKPGYFEWEDLRNAP
jgi:hypothetical protein